MSQNFEAIIDAAKRAAKAEASQYRDVGACGFAWVTVSGNEPIARYCRQRSGQNRQRYGSKHWDRGWLWWNPAEFAGQSIDAIEAGARAFRDKLGEFGIRADVGSRLD